MPHSRQLLRLMAVGISLLSVQSPPANAGEVKLKSGMVLHGTPTDIESLLVGAHKADRGPITIYPIVMVSSPLKRYFIPTRQKEAVNKNVHLSPNEAFKLPPPKLPAAR